MTKPDPNNLPPRGFKPQFKIVGLTGGIAAGKSAVANLITAGGVSVVDFDRVARDIVDADPALLRKIAELLGSDVIEKGSLDRRRVAQIIFEDASKRKELESLLHPILWTEFEKLAAEKARAGERMVVCEAALLVENRSLTRLDELIVVSASADVRLQRLMLRPQIDETLARKIMSAQTSDEKRIRAATVVIDNNGSLSELKAKVEALLQGWREAGLLTSRL